MENRNEDGAVFSSFDAQGRTVANERTVGGAETRQPVECFEYNALGDVVMRQVFTNETDSATTRFEYDAFGWMIAETNPLGETTNHGYDFDGQLTLSDGATYPVRYAYDTAGRRIMLATTRDEGAAWDTTRWEYDFTTGLRTAKIHADGSRINYTYTADGLPLRTTGARGVWKENQYDSNRKLCGVACSDGSAVSLGYDELQYLSSASNSAAAYSFVNDSKGNATNETATVDRIAVSVVRAFDEHNRIISLAVDDSVACEYSYDGRGRISEIVTPDFGVVYHYASDGAETGWTLTGSNGLSIVREVRRDPFRRELVTAITNRVNGATVEGWDFAHDALGRVVSRNGDTFGYNIRSELTSAHIGENDYQNTYDSIGNNLWADCNAATNTYFSNSLNQYESILCGFAPSREITYDADGNMTSDGINTYTYDCENRLTSVSSNDTLLASYAYDYQGRRVKKTIPSSEHLYFYDGWNLIREVIITESVTNRIDYFWGRDLSGTLQGAGGVGGLLAMSINGVSYFPLYDHNGNITDYVSATGTMVAHYEYDAFGNTISLTGSLADTFSFRFSTKYFDTETGFYYYGYRYYHPPLGRWLSRDPIEEEGGLNLYAFCGNNGINKYDKDGRAYFAYRRLAWTPFIFFNDPDSDDQNRVGAHEELFFEDGTGEHKGFYDDNQVRPDKENIKYEKPHDTGWSDCVMRLAVEDVKPRKYKLSGKNQYNCQDWADAVREAYRKRIREHNYKGCCPSESERNK